MRACTRADGSVDQETKRSLEPYVLGKAKGVPPAFYPQAKPAELSWPEEPADSAAESSAAFGDKAWEKLVKCKRALEKGGRASAGLELGQVFEKAPELREQTWLARLAVVKNLVLCINTVARQAVEANRVLNWAACQGDPGLLARVQREAANVNAASQLLTRGAFSHLLWGLEKDGLLDNPSPPFWTKPFVLWPRGDAPALEWGAGGPLERDGVEGHGVQVAPAPVQDDAVAAASAGRSVGPGDEQHDGVASRAGKRRRGGGGAGAAAGGEAAGGTTPTGALAAGVQGGHGGPAAH